MSEFISIREAFFSSPVFSRASPQLLFFTSIYFFKETSILQVWLTQFAGYIHIVFFSENEMKYLWGMSSKSGENPFLLLLTPWKRLPPPLQPQPLVLLVEERERDK